MNYQIKEDERAYKVYENEKLVATAYFSETDNNGGVFCENVDIEDDHKGKGIYKAILDLLIESLEHNEYFFSNARTELANKFWQKYVSIEDYDEDDHENGDQEEFRIKRGWEVEYE